MGERKSWAAEGERAGAVDTGCDDGGDFWISLRDCSNSSAGKQLIGQSPEKAGISAWLANPSGPALEIGCRE
jgi:hypothetical protein